MPVMSFRESHKQKVLALRDRTFSTTNLSGFMWQPCQQVESLDQESIKFVFDDDVKGYGTAYQLDDTHFRLNLIVDPRHLRKGIGSHLLQTIEQEVVQVSGKYLQARVLEVMSTSLSFAMARGFTQIHIMRGMSLHARDFSFSDWKELGQDLFARGFLLTSLKEELQSDVDAIERLVKLYRHVRKGWPSPDPTWQVDTSAEALRSQITTVKYPEHFSIIKIEGEYIGFTSAKNLATGTGVHPDYRNLGIATYLKAFNLNLCLADGEEFFESATASPAMQRVNEKLGYRFNGLSEVRLVKDLS
jgi:GNAT superfamily N-acetyltransferase